MPARFHSHTHLFLLCRQVTVEFLRFLAVLQSPLLQFPSLGIDKSNLLKARVIIASYNDHVRLGDEFHYVAVPPTRDSQPVRRFGCTTSELKEMAVWLKQLRPRRHQCFSGS